MSGAVAVVSPDTYIRIVNCRKRDGSPCDDDERRSDTNNSSNVNKVGASTTLYTQSELDEVSKLESEKSENLLDTIHAQSKLQSIHLRAQNRGLSSQISGLNSIAGAGSKSGAADAAKKASSITTDNSTISNSTGSSGSDSSVLKPDLNAIRDAINSGGVFNTLKDISNILKDNNSTSALKDIAKAIKDGGLGGGVAQALNDLNDTIKANSDKISQIADKFGESNKFLEGISKSQEEILKIEQDRHKFETTSTSIRDLDGQEVANMSPREIELSKNASQARIATDTNNFELDSSDIDDLFGDLPDITELFKFKLPGEIAREFITK